MSLSNEELRAYFGELAKKRRVENYFDRFEQDSVMSDGLKIHLDVIETDRNRPTIVFMPGTNAYALLYGEFLTALADKGFNIVGFDPRGHGRSGGARGSYVLPELVDDMRAVVGYARKRFGDPIVVMGSSQGGITSFYLAAAGDKIAGAVCHNIADLGDPDSVRLTRSPGVSRLMKPMLLVFAKIFPEMKVPMTAYLDLKAEPVRDMGTARDVLYSDPLTVPFIRLRGMASLASEKLPRPVEEIETPVMVIHAGNDTIFPQDYVEKIYNRLACKKSLKIYPGLPHYLIVDYIDTILPDVVEWIEEICK